MLGDIVGAAVSGQPDMELVGTVTTSVGAPTTVVGDRRADVLVVGRELSELMEPDRELLWRCRATTVLVVTKDGRRAFRYDLRSERVALAPDAGGVSSNQMLAAIRQAAARAAPSEHA